MFDTLQQLIILVISVAALVAAAWAFIDAFKYPNTAYVNAGKKSKTLWLVILGVAALIAFISLPRPLGAGGGIIGLLGIAAVIATIYYFVDVRPKVSGASPSSGGSRGSSGGW
ncbi:DUF2516 family protein [Demequina sp. SO4-13]|uniref:DUF2516 family protein n=1 Tax=Demequina sp. SO4-13 TaxID=3401027 RepID=UPI003AF4E675